MSESQQLGPPSTGRQRPKSARWRHTKSLKRAVDAQARLNRHGGMLAGQCHAPLRRRHRSWHGLAQVRHRCTTARTRACAEVRRSRRTVLCRRVPRRVVLSGRPWRDETRHTMHTVSASLSARRIAAIPAPCRAIDVLLDFRDWFKAHVGCLAFGARRLLGTTVARCILSDALSVV